MDYSRGGYAVSPEERRKMQEREYYQGVSAGTPGYGKESLGGLIKGAFSGWRKPREDTGEIIESKGVDTGKLDDVFTGEQKDFMRLWGFGPLKQMKMFFKNKGVDWASLSDGELLEYMKE